MTGTDVVSFGKMLSAEVLKEYMIKVSRDTREITANLTIDQLQQKPWKKQLDRIGNAGGLILDKRSIWLLDYWGRLNGFWNAPY